MVCEATDANIVGSRWAPSLVATTSETPSDVLIRKRNGSTSIARAPGSTGLSRSMPVPIALCFGPVSMRVASLKTVPTPTEANAARSSVPLSVMSEEDATRVTELGLRAKMPSVSSARVPVRASAFSATVTAERSPPTLDSLLKIPRTPKERARSNRLRIRCVSVPVQGSELGFVIAL